MTVRSILNAGVLFALCCAMVQCSFKNDDDSSNKQKVIREVETGAVEGGDLVSVAVPLETIHAYAVELKWVLPSYCKGKILKREKASAFTMVMELETLVGSKQDGDVIEAHEYSYTLICTTNGADKSIKTQNIVVPTDLTLAGEMTIPKLNEMGLVKVEHDNWLIEAPRILLEASLRLKTEGQNFEMRTSFLDAEKGSMIFSFSDDDRAETGESGKSGNSIVIGTTKGQGFLTVKMVGQDGGEGMKGKMHPLVDRGEPGGKGASSQYSIQGGAEHDDSMIETSPGHCNMTDSGGPVPCPLYGYQMTCSRNSADGQPGKIGQKGFDGTNGFNGGNSGSAKIKIESGNIQVSIEKHYGIGGPGGPGGDGAFGGSGGEPGDDNPESIFQTSKPKENFKKVIFASKCAIGKIGPDGPVGPVGDKGGPGLNGYEEKSYLFNPATGLMDEY